MKVQLFPGAPIDAATQADLNAVCRRLVKGGAAVLALSALAALVELVPWPALDMSGAARAALSYLARIEGFIFGNFVHVWALAGILTVMLSSLLRGSVVMGRMLATAADPVRAEAEVQFAQQYLTLTQRHAKWIATYAMVLLGLALVKVPLFFGLGLPVPVDRVATLSSIACFVGYVLVVDGAYVRRLLIPGVIGRAIENCLVDVRGVESATAALAVQLLRRHGRLDAIPPRARDYWAMRQTL